MILCLDVGNSQIYGGVIQEDEYKLKFRKTTKSGDSSDELGLFLTGVLEKNGINKSEIKQIAICTVVPEILHSLKNACNKYFQQSPFVLQAGVRTGLKIRYRNPLEVGADRIANAIAAVDQYPDKNIVIVDFGTAITFCAVTKDKDYLGGAIMPGLRLSMNSLESNTSRLPAVEIVKPEEFVGRSTVESIQSGLFYGTVGAVSHILKGIQQQSFYGEKPLVIGTGGFANMFKEEGLFDVIQPDLVLDGLITALKMNA